MAENQPPAMPQPPPGMPRPGIPGAGNILDPAVRGQIRELLHPVMHQAGQLARGGHAHENGGDGAAGGNDAAGAVDRPAETAAPETAAPPPPPRPAAGYRAGPFPHGDLDLSYIAANVPNEPARPRRQRATRRFYFLPETRAEDENAKPRHPPGPQPG